MVGVNDVGMPSYYMAEFNTAPILTSGVWSAGWDVSVTQYLSVLWQQRQLKICIHWISRR